MHACGHDGHAAYLLGAAQLLLKHKADFSGKVILAFQTAEEIGYEEDLSQTESFCKISGTDFNPAEQSRSCRRLTRK